MWHHRYIDVIIIYWSLIGFVWFPRGWQASLPPRVRGVCWHGTNDVQGSLSLLEWDTRCHQNTESGLYTWCDWCYCITVRIVKKNWSVPLCHFEETYVQSTLRLLDHLLVLGITLQYLLPQERTIRLGGGEGNLWWTSIPSRGEDSNSLSRIRYRCLLASEEEVYFDFDFSFLFFFTCFTKMKFCQMYSSIKSSLN